MPEWSQGTVKAGGLNIHYYRTGGDKPPVILNHGAGDDGLCWTRVAKALECDYDLIMPDARGHGKSSSGHGDYARQQRVADLRSLIEELRLDRPVIGGHSMGADTAMHLSIQNPGMARGIFLEDPPVSLPGETLMNGGKPVDQKKLGKAMVNAMRLFRILPSGLTVRMLRKAQPAYPDDDILPMASAQKRVQLDFINNLLGVAHDIFGPVDTLAQVSVPTLLIIGDKEKMAIVSREAGQRAAETNPLVELVHLPGASHNIRRDRFDGYLPALQGFLGRMYG